MSTIDPEINALGLSYDDKLNQLNSALRNLRKDTNDAKSISKQEKLQIRLKDREASRLPNLFTNLKKNANTVSSGIVPPLSHRFDEGKGRHLFSNSPQLSKTFTELYPSLASLALFDGKRQSIVDGRTVETHPCMVSLAPGATLNDFMRSGKIPTGGIDKIKTQEISLKSLDVCDQDHCSDCIDCMEHKKKFTDSLQGIISGDPDHGDSLRPLHMKNLITTLNSWAAHHDSRGGNKKTEYLSRFVGDAGYHVTQAAQSL